MRDRERTVTPTAPRGDDREGETRPARPADEGEPGGVPIRRRDVLGILGVAGASAVGIRTTFAAGGAGPHETGSEDGEPFAMLIDTTRCAGCRNCEVVCAEANGLPEPDLDDRLMEKTRRPDPDHWSVMSRHETDIGEVFVKTQCMHCNVPACASACLTKAMSKSPRGPVTWSADRCMGCRYCMISCPFDMPKFEYDSATPRIRKCRLCAERVEQGKLPACVENCPAEALTFGRRDELIAEARRRIHDNPGEYVHEIYGEYTVGGTSVLYLAAVPFDQLGFRTDMGSAPRPSLTEDFLYSVPVILTVLPALLAGIGRATHSETVEAGGEECPAES